MNDYRLESPPILRDFLSYHETIKAHSQKTVDEYFLDLRNFFRYLKQSRDPSLRGLPLNEISIMDVDLDFVKKVTLTDIYAYMTYLSREKSRRFGLFTTIWSTKRIFWTQIPARTSIPPRSKSRCRNI